MTLLRLHLPDYNEAAWNVEGQYLYPQFGSYTEYRRFFDLLEAKRTIVRLIRQLRQYYPLLSVYDLLIAGLEELLYQNRRSR